jgi:hypothetical protein
VDRELLIEIGTEELPASWLPSLTTQHRRGARRRASRRTACRRRAGRDLQHARRLTVRCGEGGRAADRSRGSADRPAGVRPPSALTGQPTPAAEWASRRRTAWRSRPSSASRRRRALPGAPQAASRQGRGRRAARRAAARCARFVPEADALGRDARGRQGRVAVRPADSLDALPVRRTRRAVHHLPHARGAGSPRAGSALGRRDLRPPLPDHERPRRTRGEGQGLRRLPEAAGRELRGARSQRAPQDRIARELDIEARRRWRARRAKPVGSRCSRRCRTSSSTRSVVSGTFAEEFLSLPEEVLTTTMIHHQHFFPGGDDQGKLTAGVPRRAQHRAGEARAHRANLERVLTARLRDARFFWDADRRSRSRPVAAPRDGALPQEAGQLSRQGGARRARWPLDCARRSAAAPTCRRGAAAGPAVQGRPRHRHGARADRAAGHDGRHLRARGRRAREVWKAIYSSLPAARGRSRRAADTRAAGRGGVTWAAVSMADKLDTWWGCSRRASGPPVRAIRTGCAARPRAVRIARRPARADGPGYPADAGTWSVARAGRIFSLARRILRGRRRALGVPARADPLCARAARPRRAGTCAP